MLWTEATLYLAGGACGDELFPCGSSCSISTEMVNSFSVGLFGSVLSLLLIPTELLVSTRLSFRWCMHMPTSTLGKMSIYCLSYPFVLFRRVLPIAYCKPLTTPVRFGAFYTVGVYSSLIFRIWLKKESKRLLRLGFYVTESLFFNEF